MIEIYYHHPLALRFTSAQTLQVINDYKALIDSGALVRVTIYGTYTDDEKLSEVKSSSLGLNLIFHKDTKIGRLQSKLSFFKEVLQTSNPVIVTRALAKSRVIRLLKRFRPSITHIHEMHEASFDYLFKKRVTKTEFERKIDCIDCILFTSDAQVDFFRKEFLKLPKDYLVLPNAVDLTRFQERALGTTNIVTYVGQLNDWKNFELIIASLSELPDSYHLRVAGGDGSTTAEEFIFDLANKYDVSTNRITYFGYVPHQRVATDVIDGSSVLVVPLGDNLQSNWLTCPMKLVEFMATGIPVVVVDKRTTRAIASEETVWFASNNPKEFADTIVVAKNHPEQKRAQQIERSRQYSFSQRANKLNQKLCELTGLG